MSSVFPYMRDSVQVSWRFNSVYIVILLLYLQTLFFFNSKRTFTNANVYINQIILKKGPCCDVWPYCSMIIKPYTSWGIDYNPLSVNDYISKVPTKRYIFQIIPNVRDPVEMVTAIIWERVLCNLFHSTGRVSLPKHLHH